MRRDSTVQFVKVIQGPFPESSRHPLRIRHQRVRYLNRVVRCVSAIRCGGLLVIDEGRIEMMGSFPDRADHLAAYSRVDVGLDTFPYNGTTTTCEALWMGVPGATLAGQVHAARVGVSLLTDVGMESLIAEDTEDYVALAVQLAQQPDRMTTLREQLRERLRHAPLCDAPGFTRSLEAALRDMWATWCRDRQERA